MKQSTYCCCYLSRLWGEPVNLREQHDAFEFFNCLVDAVDEGLKTHEEKPVIARILGGTFADQKICKGCPHRCVMCDSECACVCVCMCVCVSHACMRASICACIVNVCSVGVRSTSPIP